MILRIIKKNNIVKYFTYLILSIVIPLFLLEGGSYLINQGYNILAGINKHNENISSIETNLKGDKGSKIDRDFANWKRTTTYIYDGYISFLNPPFKSDTLNIDKLNRRENGRPYNSPFYENATEIWAFGSSPLFGYHANADDETLTAHLEKKINLNKNSKFKVINYSAPHYMIFNDLALLNRILSTNKKPHAVVLFNGYNDLISMFNTEIYKEPITGRPLSNLWKMHHDGGVIYWKQIYRSLFIYFPNTKLLYDRIVKGISIISYKLDKPKFLEKIKKEREYNFVEQKFSVKKGIKIYLSHLEGIWQILNARDIKVINIFQPGLLFTKKSLSNSEKIMRDSYFKTYFALTDKELNTFEIREILAKNRGYNRKLMYQTYDLINDEIKKLSLLYPNVSYIDINMSIDNVNEAVFTDHMHLTSFGNKLIAKEINKILN